MSGDIRQQGRSAGWRRLAAILGGLAIAAVTTVVTWAATKGVTTFDRAVTARDPVTVSVQSNPSLAAGFAGTSVDLRLPARAQPGSGPGQFCRGFRPWAQERGGVDAGVSRLQIVVQGETEGRLLISEARAVVLERNASEAGIDVRCPSAGEAEFRALSVDLDAPDTRAQYESGDGRPFGFTLDKGEIETFLVTATASRADYAWYIELVVVAEGKPVTIRVDDGGRPFRTSPPAAGRVWEWDYESAWYPSDGGDPVPLPAPFGTGPS
jgi:hypothetical protein